MAKTIQYRVEVNTSRAKDDLTDLDNQLDDINDKSKVDLLIESSSAVKSVGDVRKAYRALRDAQIEVGEGTEEFTRLGEAAAQLQNKLNAINDTTKDLTGSTLERFRSSLSRIREGILNLDIAKVTQGFTQLKTVFGGLTNGLSAARIAAIGFGTALVATGVGAFVVAIGTLVSQFDKLADAGGLIGRIFTGIGNILGGVQKKVIDFADALGLVDENQTKVAKSAREADEERRKQLKTLAELEEAEFNLRKEKGLTTKQEEEERKLAKIKKEETKDIIALEKELVRVNDERNKAQKEYIQLLKATTVVDESFTETSIQNINEAYSKLNREQKDFIDSLVRQELANRKNIDTNEKIKNQVFKIGQFYLETGIRAGEFAGVLVEQALAEEKLNNLTEEQLDIQNRLIKVREIARLAALKAEEERKKEEEERKKAIQDALNQRLAQIRLEGEIDREDKEERLQSAKDFFDKEYKLFEDAEAKKKALSDKIKSEIRQTTDEIIAEAERRIEREKQLEEELTQFKLEQEQAKRMLVQESFFQSVDFNNALSNLITQLYANEIAQAEGNFERQEELRKESFEANKALQIANTVITTAQAVMNGLNAGLQIGGPWGIALGAATAAAAAVTGGVQIAAIEATRYQPGSGGGSTVSAPTFSQPTQQLTPNVVFAGEGTTLNQIGQGSNNQFMNLSASISVSEINSVQNQVAVYESGSLIGG